MEANEKNVKLRSRPGLHSSLHSKLAFRMTFNNSMSSTQSESELYCITCIGELCAAIAVKPTISLSRVSINTVYKTLNWMKKNCPDIEKLDERFYSIARVS